MEQNVEKLQKKLQELQKERDEFLAGWQRAKADFLNYKKEEGERMQGVAGYAKDELVCQLFVVLDNLERAEKELAEGDRQSKMAQGFLQIGKQLREFLASHGIKEVEAEGKEFDPKVHEAVGTVSGEKPGNVAEVVEKGYTLNSRLLRAAKVKVVK